MDKNTNSKKKKYVKNKKNYQKKQYQKNNKYPKKNTNYKSKKNTTKTKVNKMVEPPKKEIVEKEVIETPVKKETKKTKNIKKTIFIILISIGVIILLTTAYFLTKFRNVNLELGDNITINDFVVYGSSRGVNVDLSKVNKDVIGKYPVSLKYLLFEYDLVVDVADRTPPEFEVQNISKAPNYEVDVNDFITDINDKSEYEVSYLGDVDTSLYGDYEVNIMAKDIYNNEASKKAILSIAWVKNEYETETGKTIKIEDLVYDTKDKDTISQAELDEINKQDIEGEYYLNSTKDGNTIKIKITKVRDLTPPELVLKDLTLYVGKKIKGVNDFVTKAVDKKSKVTLTMLTTIDYSKLGKQTISIEASDESGNKVVKTATLKIIKDTEGPTISGLSKITIKKDKSIDFRKGVSSYDKNTGKCDFTVDSSKVDIHKYGTYVAYYTSKDGLGNVTKSKRVVVVTHDQADTRAKVKSVADTLPKDAEKIRDWVRNNISYNTNWGGDDPVWYGLTNKAGNCYVRAKILDALLKYKGFTTKLIWTTYKSHYWNMVYLNGKWWHMDSTPMAHHSKYSLMNDEQRLEGLSGRTWDRKAWPTAG